MTAPHPSTTPVRMHTASADWHRMHPLSLVIDIAERARSIIGTMVSLLVMTSWLRMPRHAIRLAASATLLGMAVIRIVAWSRKRYRLNDDGITMEAGILNTVRTTIAYDRIHTINITTPFVLRPFGLVSIAVESGGISNGSSITLTAVPQSVGTQLERLRRRATDIEPAYEDRSNTKHDEHTAVRRTVVHEDAGRLAFRASVRDTVLFALTDLEFLAALLVLYGFAQNLEDLLPRKMFYSAQESIIRFSSSSTLSMIITIATGLLMILAISIVKSLMLYYRFEVWRRGDDLIIVRGFFTRRSFTIPVGHVQTVTIHQSVLRRALHLSSVQVGLTTSGADDDELAAMSAGGILPVVADDRLYATLAVILPEWNLHVPPATRTAHGLGRYLLTMPITLTVIGTLGTATASSSPGPADSASSPCSRHGPGSRMYDAASIHGGSPPAWNP
ncbi:hypothetical protein EP30_01845 [Bifidobacterium sp. UTCIF-39]|uniref:PH domain-containing protein n=1 Tax=Bifidobacterium sp. UTCIF-39 TaxID=1465359 RepID=UPI00112DA1C6|nr:PH domain-containing protein [Bifidobacterium sp. UTCIF-39]TPF97706.1 hypothetical protein EP30_01845 [Bifidobacterium sp. UTCIF-39]